MLYVRDIDGVETVTTPDVLLSRGPQFLKGDCDDMSLLSATMLESIGYPTRFIITGYANSTDFSHIFVLVDVDGKTVPFDVTTRQFNYVRPGAKISRIF